MIDELLAIVAPPARPLHATGDWAAVEAALGTALPSDFRAMTERYGAGGFAGEIHPLTPFWAECPMETRVAELTEYERGRGRAWFPEPGGLLLWATGGSGQWLAWRTGGGAPDAWRTAVLLPRDDEYEEHELDATGLLAAWLDGRLARSLLGKRPGENDSVAPWFDPAITRVLLTVHLDAPSKEAAPVDDRVARVVAALGGVIPRGRFRGAEGAAQDHFALGDWKVTYDSAYGHNLRVAFPPDDEPAVRAAVDAVVAALGATVRTTSRT